MEITLADHLGTGTLDSVEHRGQVFEDVPAVWASLPTELEHGDYSVRAVFGEHGEFGLRLADDEVLWIAVPAETLAAAEDLGLLGVVTGDNADGTLDYFLIWWEK